MEKVSKRIKKPFFSFYQNIKEGGCNSENIDSWKVHFKIECLVMELLGPNLEDLFQYCGGKFSLKTTTMIAFQVKIKF